MARAGRPRGADVDTGAARQAILGATVATLADVGYSATSARAIATRAGVAPGGVFYHFGSMDDLLAEAFETCNDGRIERLRTAVGERPTASALVAATRQEFASPESRALLELVVGSINSPTLAAHVRAGVTRSVAFTSETIAALVADSPVRDVLPTELIAEIAASAYFGLEVLGQIGHEADLEALGRLVELLLALLQGPAR